MKTYTINVYSIDEYLWDVQKSMWKTLTMNETSVAIDPLKYYVKTGRASTAFLRKLIQVKPYVMARYLIKIRNNSVDHAIELIKQKVGYEY